MNEKRNPKLKTGRLACVLALALSAAAGAARADQFTTTLVNPGGRPTTLPVVIHIDRYSTDAEVQKLSGILARKGPEAFRSALWDLEKGYIRIGNGGLGYPIAVATSKPAANGERRIRLMMDRPVSFREFASGARSLDYPFSYVEINLGRDGKGEGQMFAAARISLTAGTVDVENYSFQPLKLLAVRAR
ncbi:MAG TPA: hypothetical protein VIC28_18410 [Thermoanaerobaculia bacterium]|jgi:hypothetical protein